jgi:uncharacterized protein YoxC
MLSIKPEETSTNNNFNHGVQSIVQAAETMTAAIQDIAGQLSQSMELIENAVVQARSTSEYSVVLDDAAKSANQVVSLIDGITTKINLLALNATIEAARAGDVGKGFAVVASEVKQLANQTSQATGDINSKIHSIQSVSKQVLTLAQALHEAISHVSEYSNNINVVVQNQTSVISAIHAQTQTIAEQFEHQDVLRLTEMSQTLVQLIVRNLYERTADVRWWATDEAFYSCMEHKTKQEKSLKITETKKSEPNLIQKLWSSFVPPAESEVCKDIDTSKEYEYSLKKAHEHATSRLELINRFYSVYLNLVLVDMQGNIVAISQPQKFPNVLGANVSKRQWFINALATKSGDDYVVEDIYRAPLHGDKMVAVYATSVRENGKVDGKPLGVLGVYFDWDEQSRSIVCDEPNLSPDEWQHSRVLLLDGKSRIIAASDGKDLLQHFPLQNQGKDKGHYIDEQGNTIAYARTIGYQEYDGLGWCGVIIQKSKA